MLDACFISIPPSLSRCLILYLLSLLLSQSGYSKLPAPFLCSELLSSNYASSFSIPCKKKQTTSSNSSLIDQGHSRHTQHFISFLGGEASDSVFSQSHRAISPSASKQLTMLFFFSPTSRYLIFGYSINTPCEARQKLAPQVAQLKGQWLLCFTLFLFREKFQVKASPPLIPKASTL